MISGVSLYGIQFSHGITAKVLKIWAQAENRGPTTHWSLLKKHNPEIWEKAGFALRKEAAAKKMGEGRRGEAGEQQDKAPSKSGKVTTLPPPASITQCVVRDRSQGLGIIL